MSTSARVVDVEHLGHRRLRISFRDGLVRELDFEGVLTGILSTSTTMMPLRQSQWIQRRERSVGPTASISTPMFYTEITPKPTAYP